MTKIAVIDYGMGNVRSVCNAVEAVGGESLVAMNPSDLEAVDGIILPGVGAFGDGMENLKNRGWDEALSRQVIEGGKPFLGICLGMQLLAERGSEHGSHAGLGWLAGTVERLPGGKPEIRIPHIGWNDLSIDQDSDFFEGVPPNSNYYFVHSYVFEPQDSSIVAAECEYGKRFVAAVRKENIFATQFHPEKSQRAGLTLLRNFLTQAGLSC
jgi:glutamine amidotransferase